MHPLKLTYKHIIAFTFIIALALASPLTPPRKGSLEAQPNSILRFENENNGVDGYKFAFETSDGQQRQEQGELKKVGEEEALVVRGSYSFTADDGQVYTVNYVADENGFQPEGAHLPTV
ncbi:endocuticle structural glycoprotein ABD-5-like [Anopheles ziemanni]|uniref:endocuticle structural glycoprotein ABD-5-like n=1 Tax=Anopheles coustani TaxID=139045 RepID=UPI002657F80A|nr:endocuticle structural glycoprotein ABD-5-like [Anopheles coustani]XP_058177974.1 endocuticle structural glycoprotein ABD-5-like [Anopheles ziemanni]